jgi:hypothetical protein
MTSRSVRSTAIRMGLSMCFLHVAQVRQHCEPGDPMRRPRQRQALLHWAYDSRRI